MSRMLGLLLAAAAVASGPEMDDPPTPRVRGPVPPSWPPADARRRPIAPPEKSAADKARIAAAEAKRQRRQDRNLREGR